MNYKHLLQAATEALSLINAGYSEYDLVHIQYYPQDYYCYEDEIMGLSTPIAAGSNMGGYTNDYWTLGELAFFVDYFFTTSFKRMVI